MIIRSFKLNQNSKKNTDLPAIGLSSERGLTLVEIIIVLIILATLMGFLVSKLTDTGQAAKQKLNVMKMEKLKGMINQYQLQFNQIPSALDNLVRGPGTGQDSFVPIASADDLKDIWGTNFIYSLENNGRSYRIKTLGADGIEGGSGVDFDTVLAGP